NALYRPDVEGAAGTRRRYLPAGTVLADIRLAGVFITDAEAAPTLLPGNRVLLFLKRSPILSAGYEAQSFTGTVRLSGGSALALEGSPLKSSLDGKAEAELIKVVSKA